MGSASSKFKKYIQNGDEYAAMQIYQSSPELKKSFDPNLSYGESRHHNTAMHYAARYGMKHLLRTFLNELGGDPNKRNAFDETVLHSACSAGTAFPPPHHHTSISCVQLTGDGGNIPGSSNSANSQDVTAMGALTASVQERRAACISLLLQWRGIRLPSSDEKERIQLDALDREGNSALHLAAGAGLVSGARLLLAAGAHSLTKDSRGRTAAQRALIGGHQRLTALIERAMLFSEEPIEWCNDRWGWTASEINEEESEEVLVTTGGTTIDSHEGLRPQELREAKDRLLVDTSDMLRVSLFTAEALLRDNEWCRDVLVERWMKDATVCCQSAGVSLPGGSLDSEHPEESMSVAGEQKVIECGICCEEVMLYEAGSGSCGHTFCTGCWGRYLKGRICEGEPRPACPAPRCKRAVPHYLLQRCLTPRTQRKYLLFDIKAFVESSRGMKWCPVAGCGRAVKLHETELSTPMVNANTANDTEEECFGGYPTVSRGVDCGDFHFFCWECNGEPHPPLSCSAWSRWVTRAGTVPPAPLTAAAGGAESAASSLWLLAHCKPCPSCSCPIQKNDGCNHMKCTKCKFDFCWVCLESWKRHGSATGGYFRCTREEATARAEQSRGNALAEARIHNAEAQEQWRFALQCARFRRHEQRWLLERPLLIATPAKTKALDPTNISKGVLEASARELGLCRRMLIGCCAYTFVLPTTAPHRAAFFYAQEELERCTGRLAKLIACEVVEASLVGLRRATNATRRWRLTVARLARPPPPPVALSAQELRMMARLLLRGRLDPRDPWRFPLGPRGEPLRVSDPFDPDNPILQESQSSTVSPHISRDRPMSENDTDVYRINVSEYNMDLIIALEMSRLQMLEEQARRHREAVDSSMSQETPMARNRQRPARLNISVSIGASQDSDDKNLSDDQLKLAIQLSLQEPMSRNGTQRRFDAGETSTSVVDSSAKENAVSSSDSTATWSIRKERNDNGHNTADIDRSFDKSWSKAADITVGYFLKALGRTPLDLPNLALDFDLSNQRREIINDQSTSRTEENTSIESTNENSEDSKDSASNGLKSRPPLLRSQGASSRPPLLRQLGGKMKRSRSMGDLSVRSSSTDETITSSRMADECIQVTESDNPLCENSNSCTPNAIGVSYCSKSQQSLNLERKTVTKCIQIDADIQQHDDFKKEYGFAIRNGVVQETFHHNVVTVQALHPKSNKDSGDHRKKASNFPKNLPWGEFCCEKKCVKTNPIDSAISAPRYYDKKEKYLSISNIIVSEPDSSVVSVDCRGKLNAQAIDYSEKPIHLPDLNSSHLKVNTHLTKLAINKHVGLLGDSPKHCLNQNDIVSDTFRRHSDHIPRTDRNHSKVKAASSEKYIGGRVKGVEASPERSRTSSPKESKLARSTDSPKKATKTENSTKVAPSLSIKIVEGSVERGENVGKTKRGLETDSSNECESETGIPKSPTLYISGVSICREPSLKGAAGEQKSPKCRQKIAWKEYEGPVVVHVTSPSISPCSDKNATEVVSGASDSDSGLRSGTPTSSRYSEDVVGILDVPMLPPSHFSDDVFYDEDDPALLVDCVTDSPRLDYGLTETVYAGCHSGGIMISNMPTLATLKSECSVLNRSMFNINYARMRTKNDEALYENVYPERRLQQAAFDMSLPNSPTACARKSMHKSSSAKTLMSVSEVAAEPHAISKLKSRSANEPERDREMFRFPKSSTDGALSSVLHVQESNLSSDDFHEALFLLERSPKTRDSKRRKRSKKREKLADKDQLKDADESASRINCTADAFKKDETIVLVVNVEHDSPSIEQDEASSAL